MVFVKEMPDRNDDKAWAEFQEEMNEHAEAVNSYIEGISKELNVSEGTASDIWYLRTRSRWSQELENRIVMAAKAGHTISPMHPEKTEVQQLEEVGF